MWTAPPVAGRSGWGGAYRGDFSLAIAEDRVDNLARFLFLRARLTGNSETLQRWSQPYLRPGLQREAAVELRPPPLRLLRS